MLSNFKSWMSEPFQTDMDLFHWMLFILLLLIILGFWGMVLRHLTSAIR